MVHFSFAGTGLIALPQGALFWPARKALLVADLHLEKASWFARFGQMLPPYDSIATLTDLTALAETMGADEIWCLGDSFHDRHGCDRLPAQARDLLTALTARVRWTWITGNHDPGIADHCGGEVVEEAYVDGLLLRHEADPAEPRPELSGHYHPKLRISLRGQAVAAVAVVEAVAEAPDFVRAGGGDEGGEIGQGCDGIVRRQHLAEAGEPARFLQVEIGNQKRAAGRPEQGALRQRHQLVITERKANHRVRL